MASSQAAYYALTDGSSIVETSSNMHDRTDSGRESFESPERGGESGTAFEQLILEKSGPEAWLDRRRKGCSRRTGWLWISQLIILSTSIAFFIFGLLRSKPTDRGCYKQVYGSYSPAYSVLEFDEGRLQGAIGDENPWKGAPSPALDDSWDLITNQNFFSISAEEMKKLKKPLTQIRWPEEKGGGFVAGLEVFHQLHCLNSLRKYTYRDYYAQNASDPLFSFDPATMRLHLDHCIDMIRQILMCHADVGLVTQSWVKGYPNPYPDFSVEHKCSNLVPLVKFTMDRRIKGSPMSKEESAVLEKPPCEKAGEETKICPNEDDLAQF